MMLHRFQYSGKKANLDFWSEDMEKNRSVAEHCEGMLRI